MYQLEIQNQKLERDLKEEKIKLDNLAQQNKSTYKIKENDDDLILKLREELVRVHSIQKEIQ